MGPSSDEASPFSAVVAVLAGFAAACLAAGSVGPLEHGLRHALIWAALLVALFSARPKVLRPWPRMAVFAVVLLGAAGLLSSNRQIPNVMAVGLVLLALAWCVAGPCKRILMTLSAAVALFALYRLLFVSVPLVWVVADGCGGLLSGFVGKLTGRACLAGPTFAGLDYLLVALSWYGLWLSQTPSPRRKRALVGAVGIAVAHAVYLILIASFASTSNPLPALPVDAEAAAPKDHPGFLPWGLPALGLLLHGAVLCAMVRWAAWKPEPSVRSEIASFRSLSFAGVLVAAVTLACSATLCTGNPDLSGRKVVVYEKGYLNWLEPKHGDYGRLSIGMYGLLPAYLRSLGATCLVSPTLSEEDLRDADVLVLIYPDQPWEAGLPDRIWKYVRDGGALIVLGEHTVREKDGANYINEILSPSAIRVRFDSGTFAIGGWLKSYETLAHPATLGIPDDQNQFGVVIGASLSIAWPARPLIVGRWGWSDAGDEGRSSMMGNGEPDPGEKMGDLILVAEQEVGEGRVVVFGDTSTFSNGINMSAYPFTSRLFAYLAHGRSSPSTAWRAILTLLAGLALSALCLWRLDPCRFGAAILVLAVLNLIFVSISHRSGEAIPRGRSEGKRPLAYLDTSHFGDFSCESWRSDGLMGLALTLMRNGYLVLTMSEFNRDRLMSADLFVTVAPRQSYSDAERDTVRAFTENGGMVICAAGSAERETARTLLKAFDFDVAVGQSDPEKGPKEAIPLGFFKSPYVAREDHRFYVRFHAAWPISCAAPDARVIAYGAGDVPVIIMRTLGKGRFVLIGDSDFATNKNLEYEGGQPFEGLRENADFWRWMLSGFGDGPVWYPERPRPPDAPGADAGAPETPEEKPVEAP